MRRVQFSRAIDQFVSDLSAQGRMRSRRTEQSYRATLTLHGEDVGNRDPATTNREDVKRTLARWSHPNTYRTRRAVLVSFYRWTNQEGFRKDNPAEQTRPARRIPPQVYKMRQEEAAQLLAAAVGTRERRAIYLGVCAGLRSAELRGLQGRHFVRPGVILVSTDIAKGARERELPVLPELAPVVDEIRQNVGLDDYVLPAQRWRDPGANKAKLDLRRQPSSAQALYYLVKRVAARAGIQGNVSPHAMRRGFADVVTRGAGDVRTAQSLLGHASLSTTEQYLGPPTLDELAAAIAGVRVIREAEQTFSPLPEPIANPVEAPTGIEPVYAALQAAA